jgi:hypothetical protein
LPFSGGDLGGDGGGIVIAGHDLAGDGDLGGIVGDGGVVLVDGGVVLPAACAQLTCVPASMEGDVNLSGASVSGCHAYDRLTITGTVNATQFFACANSISIAGALQANGGGDVAATGVGAGVGCANDTGASGGGYGGGGADPGDCGGGAPFGDSAYPRAPGSGGGGSGGGAGGGVIELACGSLNLLTLISANGLDGSGDAAGGGAGGSVLIESDSVLGGGQILARGGRGGGKNGGGGGGGRVAIYATANAARFDIDVSGGTSTVGSVGGTGTIKQ